MRCSVIWLLGYLVNCDHVRQVTCLCSIIDRGLAREINATFIKLVPRNTCVCMHGPC